ncbi:MAG: MmgE/PrpD family protein, partial [Planctomycetales bacterium]
MPAKGVENSMTTQYVTLARDENQALGLGRFAIDFLAGKFPWPEERVLQRVELFHLDSIACAVSALAEGANAPRVLRDEAQDYSVDQLAGGAFLLGSRLRVQPEKAAAANSSAAREWDANGTNFGWNPDR